MKRTIGIIFFLSAVQCFAQPSDFIILKKKDKTIARYYADMDINFTTNTGAYMNGRIQRIKNDTLFLKEYLVRTAMTQLGVYVLDTVATYYHQYHYNQVYAIGKKSKGLNLSASAASLMGGGILLSVGSGIVYLADRENFSPALLITAASLGTLGYILAKTGGKGIVMGKKYKLVYVSLSGNKKL
jgi:hypothetical protein